MVEINYNNLIFVDCEATGNCPAIGELTEFGAVHYPSRATFYGDLKKSGEKNVFESFDKWLLEITEGRKPIFVSDNPAFDWQWINYGFWHSLNKNPFGWSARRISDFYAGLMGDFSQTQHWKRLRITPHTHNPVDDAMGNVEAFERLLNGER
jgi:hypothetical protein